MTEGSFAKFSGLYSDLAVMLNLKTVSCPSCPQTVLRQFLLLDLGLCPRLRQRYQTLDLVLEGVVLVITANDIVSHRLKSS